MSITDKQYEIVINNKRIWEYYNDNKHITPESANLLLVDFMENIFNEMSTDISTNINSQLLSYMKESKHQIDSIKMNINTMNENISKINAEIANNMVVQFMNLKKDYIEDVRQIIQNSTLTTSEKISSLMDKNNDHLINKTTVILNDIIPKNQDNFNKDIAASFKIFYNQISEDTNKLAKSVTNDKGFNEFLSSFETKYNSMLQNMQQPLYSFFSASENRITQNIDMLKETSSTSLAAQNKLYEELGEFLGKYNVSSNKGKYGEQNLSSILTSLYQSAEIKDTTGTKASGDFIMKRIDKPPILFENKDYKTNIDKDEVAKFIRDVDTQNMSGVFISQYSGIAFKQNYQIDIHKGNVLIYIQHCEYSPEKIRIAVDIIDSLHGKLEDLNLDDDTNTISKEMLNDINEEYQAVIAQKEAMLMVLKDFQKRMTTQIEDIKLPVLDKYLSQKYAYVKTRSFVCDLCNVFDCNSKQSLSAHKRGCSKKIKAATVTDTVKANTLRIDT